MLHLINELRAYLVDQEIVRTPDGEGDLPPAHLAPPAGTPAPGEGSVAGERSDIVVGIFPSASLTLGAFEQGWLVRESADLYIRTGAHNQPAALELARTIRRSLADRRGFDLGQLRIEQCLEGRSVSLVAVDEAQGATYVMTLDFLVRDSAFGA